MSFGTLGELLTGSSNADSRGKNRVELVLQEGQEIYLQMDGTHEALGEILDEDLTDPRFEYTPGAREAFLDRSGRGPQGDGGEVRADRLFLRGIRQAKQ